jgi:hypothetical protein
MKEVERVRSPPEASSESQLIPIISGVQGCKFSSFNSAPAESQA